MYLNQFRNIQPYVRLGLVNIQRRCYEKAALHRPKLSQEMNIHKANSDSVDGSPSGPVMTEMFPTTRMINKEPIVLSFDDVPGPKASKYISNFRQYISEMGTQLTVGMLTVALNVGTYLNTKKPLKNLSGLFDEYGPVVRFVSPVGGDIVLINHPEHIQKVYAMEGDYPMRSNLDSLEKYRSQHRNITYGGLYSVHGEQWSRQRSVVLAPLNHSVTQQIVGINDVCEAFTQKMYNLRNHQDEVPKDLYKELHKWAFDCMGLVLFSKRFTMLDTELVYSQCDMSWLYHSLEKATDAIIKCESGLHFWKLFSTPSWNSLVKYCDSLDNLIGKHVIEAEKAISFGSKEQLPAEFNNNLSLINAMLTGEDKLNAEDIVTVIMDMLLIGVNTITSSMSFLLYYLAKYQRAQKILFREIDTIGAKFDVNDMKKITELTPYLQACIKETLRLSHPIPVLTRILPKNITIDKYNIPRGTLIIMSTQDASLKEGNYDDAAVFYPERWLKEDAQEYHAFASIPFGFGARKCLGQNMSETMMTLLTIRGKHTSNLKSHLAVKHIAEYKIVEEINTNQTTAKKKKFNPDADVVKKIKFFCMQLVTVHGRPLAMMDDEAFQQIITLTLPSNAEVKQINIKAIKESISEQAYRIKQKIYEEIKHQLISLKLDSATCSDRKFIGINIQYIKNAQIVVRNLAVIEVTDPQTGTFLKNTLEDVLTEFNITTDHIYCVCTDNGSNMVKMVKLIGGKYCVEEDEQNEENNESAEDDFEETVYEDNEERNALLENEENESAIFNEDFEVEDILRGTTDFKIRGMLCAAHTLQLAIKDAINDDISVQTTINLSRTIINILRKPNNINKIKLANQKKTINDCKTRWTATYNMLQRLISLKDFCNTINELNSLVSSNFWVQIKGILECLKPANAATIVLQRQNLTIGDFYITWVKCRDEIQEIDQPFARNLQIAMQEREKQLFNNDVVLESLFLDRRLNLILNNQKRERAKVLLRESFQQLLKLKRDAADEVNTYENELSIPGTSSGFCSLEERLIRADRQRGSTRHITSFEANLNELTTAPRIPLDENIISHWNSRTVILTDFVMLANTVLAAPATQVSVERLFSSLKFILHPLRSNLSKVFLKDLMFVRENKDLLD